VQILSHGGGGSGIVWDGGRILTNSHVLRGDAIEVVDAQGRRMRARLIRRDNSRDLALLETNAALEPATFGDSDAVRAGQFVIAVGTPLGLAGAVAAGIVHASGSGEWIEADIRLAPGNSGGILADAEGRVIGINTMIYRGLGLAIPSNRAAAFVRGEASEARAA
jgi:serine protease Do